MKKNRDKYEYAEPVTQVVPLCFDQRQIPVCVARESVNERIMHSEIAHRHDGIELIAITHGTVRCRAAGELFDLYKGDVCFINRDRLHRLFSDTDSKTSHEVLIVGSAVLTKDPFLYEKYIRPILEDVQFAHIRFSGKSSPAGVITEKIRHIEDTLRAQEAGYEFVLLSDIYQVCRQLYLAHTNKDNRQLYDPNAGIQEQMSAFIEEHFRETISLNDIADAGGVSRSQCTKLFNHYTGLSPIAYLNRYRLERSLERLRGADESIAKIAQECGFADQSYYNRLFLREYGCTPLAYRKGKTFS